MYQDCVIEECEIQEFTPTIERVVILPSHPISRFSTDALQADPSVPVRFLVFRRTKVSCVGFLNEKPVEPVIHYYECAPVEGVDVKVFGMMRRADGYRTGIL